MKRYTVRGTVRSFVKQLKHNKRMQRIVIAVMAVIVILLALLIYSDIQHNSIYKTNENVSGSVDTIEYNGREYSYNEGIQTILLIGIDSTGEMKTSKDYGEQARADNIDLIIFDKTNKRIKVLPISRDTITDVMNFTAKGYDAGTLRTHLGLAFSFGNGGHASSINVCHSVQNLLYGAKVYKYVTTNIDSIAYANNLIGGVTVTVPNNDLAGKYPEMTKGANVALTDANVADFLRYRDTAAAGSNNGRMERQQAFLEAYIKKLEKMSKSDYEKLWEQLSKDKSKIRTNMSENLFMNLIANVKKYKYEPSKDNLKIEGENTVEDGYDAFYPDEAKLKKLVVETFYIG